MKELGDYAFSNCESLQSVICKGNIRKIGADCLSNCSSLTNVTFEGTVRDMGIAAFSGCTALQAIILPDAISSIRFLFQNCTSLERVVLPDGMKQSRRIPDFALLRFGFWNRGIHGRVLLHTR